MPETPSQEDRGRKVVQVFDAVLDRLVHELKAETVKPALLVAALDVLRFTEFNPRSHVSYPQTLSARLTEIAEATENQRRRPLPALPPPDLANQSLRGENTPPFKT
jgi:hypothetical protein